MPTSSCGSSSPKAITLAAVAFLAGVLGLAGAGVAPVAQATSLSVSTPGLAQSSGSPPETTMLRRYPGPTGFYDRPVSAIVTSGRVRLNAEVRVQLTSTAPKVQLRLTSGGSTRTATVRTGRDGTATWAVTVAAADWQPNPLVRARARGSRAAASLWVTVRERRDPGAQTATGPLVLALDMDDAADAPEHILANPLYADEIVVITWSDVALPGTNYRALTNGDIWLLPTRQVALVGRNPLDGSRALLRRNVDGTITTLTALPAAHEDTCGPWSVLVDGWIGAGDLYDPTGPCVMAVPEMTSDLITWANVATGETRTGRLPGYLPGARQVPQAQTCDGQPCVVLADGRSQYASQGLTVDGRVVPFTLPTQIPPLGPCPSTRVCTRSDTGQYAWVDQQGTETVVHIVQPDGTRAAWPLPDPLSCPAGSTVTTAVGTWIGTRALRAVVYCSGGSMPVTLIMDTSTGRVAWAEGGTPPTSLFYPIEAWFSDNWAS